MPILYRSSRSAMQFRSRDRHQFENIVGPGAGSEFGFDIFGVRLAIRTRVEPRHHDGFVFRRNTGLRSCYENE